MMESLDGYVEGPDHDLTWHNVDAEFNVFAAEQLHNAGVLVFGHRTHDMMYDFWPSDEAKTTDPVIAGLMNNMTKAVFSKTLQTAEWNNTEIFRDVDQGIQDLKHSTSNDVLVLGSSNLCVSLLEHKLLDELRIMVNPVAIGAGTPLFQGLKQPLKLELKNTRQFQNGNILLTYLPTTI